MPASYFHEICRCGVPMWAASWFTIGVLAVVLLVSGCSATMTDSEYAQKLATARKDGAAGDIVGIWVSKFHPQGHSSSSKTTLLIRPNGTGRMMGRHSSPLVPHMEYGVTWFYSGNGAWVGSAHAVNSGFLRESPFPYFDFTLHYTGRELLMDEHAIMRSQFEMITRTVFVRAEDEPAVEEQLRRR